MPFTLSWRQHPIETNRIVLWGKNDTLLPIHDINVNVPEANAGGFYFPGPMAVGDEHGFWSPTPGRGPYDVSRMNCSYYIPGDIQVTEPLLPS